MFCDISNPENRKQLASFIDKEFGRIDVLFANAGIIIYKRLQMEITEEQFDKLVNVNIKGTMLLIRDCINLLKKGKDANILVTSSITSVYPAKYVSLFR